jgi:hypothetical protein
MVIAPGPIAQLYELRGRSLSADEKAIINRLENLTYEQEKQGRDLEALNLQFHWTSANESLPVKKLIEDAYIHGGNAPNEEAHRGCLYSWR